RGTAIDSRWSSDRGRPERMSAAVRREFYARAFGAPGGTSDSEPNRDFDRLWSRFLSAIASLVREIQQSPALEDASTLSALQETARTSGRDLATNLSRHGF